MESRVQALERARASYTEEAQEMQLHLEELEDRSHRNNLRLRGIPEATGSEDLAETVTAIFIRLMESPPPTLEIVCIATWAPNPRTPPDPTICYAAFIDTHKKRSYCAKPGA